MHHFLMLVLFLTICFLAEIFCEEEKNFAFHFNGFERVNSSGDYISYDIQITKQEDSNSVFLVNGNIDVSVELNDEYKSEITIYRSDTVDGEYSEFMKLPKVGVCVCMKTFYAKYFYENVKDHSNLPQPENCPLAPSKFWIKDCPFDANVFKHMSKPGFYLVKAYLVKDDEIKTGIIVRGFVTEV